MILPSAMSQYTATAVKKQPASRLTGGGCGQVWWMKFGVVGAWEPQAAKKVGAPPGVIGAGVMGAGSPEPGSRCGVAGIVSKGS